MNSAKISVPLLERPCFLLVFLVAVGWLGLGGKVPAQPQPGDVFREYRWTNAGGDAGGSMRVGGRLDYGGGAIKLPHDFDLVNATKAEIVIEKVLCRMIASTADNIFITNKTVLHSTAHDGAGSISQ